MLPTNLPQNLPQRYHDIFSLVVEAHLRSGQPVGSRTLAGGMNLSAATIRNIMQDLEEMELLIAPHISAGRIPTTKGLRFYVDKMMEVETLSPADQRKIEEDCSSNAHSPKDVLAKASATLSSLSNCVSLVLAPQSDQPLKQIGFAQLAPNRALAVLVAQDGHIENRLIDTPAPFTQADLERVSNYLNARIAGKTLHDAHQILASEQARELSEFNHLQLLLIEQGIAIEKATPDMLVVRGQSALFQDDNMNKDQIQKARDLIAALEEKKFIADVLDMTRNSQKVEIFIGAENKAIPEDWSMITAPYYDAQNKYLLGVVGVIGPTSLNYRKVVPIVMHTSQVVKNILSMG